MDNSNKSGKQRKNPISQANLFSFTTFWWMNVFFRKGYKQTLQENDMYEVTTSDSSEVICSKLERSWKCEIERAQASGNKPSLFRAVIRAFWLHWMLLGLFGLIEETLHVLNPLFIRGLLQYFEDVGSSSDAYLYASGIFLVLIALTILHHVYFYFLQRIGWHLRAGMCSLMYKKTLRLSQYALANTTTGQIVNLGASDVMRFDLVALFLHYLFLAPLQAIVVTYLLWKDLGPSSLAGLCIIFMVMVGQSLIGRQFGRLRAQMAVLTDERIRIMNEVIVAMRIVKMYTWENSFRKIVDDIRRREVGKILHSSILKACNFSMIFLVPKLLALVTFSIFVVLGGHLTASVVFSALALYNTIRLSMGLFFPLAIEKLSESLISLKRIQKFLLLDEISMDYLKNSQHCRMSDCSVELKDVTASWTAEEIMSRPTLSRINIKIESGKLLAVIGSVGAGKSSFLSTILRELHPTEGEVVVKGQVVYAGQVPWVFSGSIKENILFGEEYFPSRYDAVINACALEKDIEALEHRDQTLVGERGVTLSGGQKARINLARAVYRQNSNIVLLDDPLSAVDAAVAAQLFNNCICGYLKNKICILVTHQLHFLKRADQVLILKDGAMAGLGTFDELQAKGTDFATLLLREEEEKQEEISSLSASQSCLKNSISINQDNIRVSHSFMSMENINLVSASTVDFPSDQDDGEDFIRSYSMSDAMPQFKHRSQERKITLRSTEELAKPLLNNKAEFVAPVGEEETKAQGSIGFKVYIEYFRTSYMLLLPLVFLSVLNHVCFVICDWFLSLWATQYEQHHLHFNNTRFNLSTISPNTTLSLLDDYNAYYVTVFGISVIIFAILMYGRAILQFYYCVRSGITMHDKMFHAVLQSHMRFFDINPVGRILNRFSKDMAQIDELLPPTFMDFIYIFFTIITILIMAITINYFVGIVVLPLVAYFLWLRQYYIKTSRDIKRMEGASRSPVFTHLSSTLQGITTVRAFGMEKKFEREFHARQDVHSAAWFLFLTGSRWFALRLDAICTIFIGTVAYCSVLTTSVTNVDAGQVGLTLTYSMMLMGMFQWGTRQSAEVENLMTSVERVQDYYKIPPEAPHEKPDYKPPPGWPQYGIITFENLSYAHYKGGPNILHRIRLNIKAHEKVGIVGRTGAGKSSLIATLFRFNEYSEGEVYIDGIPTSQLGLSDLRSAISIIPQDPILFAGTMRKNLDIFSNYTDSQLWTALEQVQLKTAIESLPLKLESELSEAGSNFSVGQRQLVCLARAILRNNKILIIDEATANVDIGTDQLVQETIRSNFKYCTVLTIAHRLNTIIDSDRLVVLDAGRVVEFDEPHLLLEKEESIFRGMVEASGKSEASLLRANALKSYEYRHASISEVRDGDRSYMARFLPTPGTYDYLELETNI